MEDGGLELDVGLVLCTLEDVRCACRVVFLALEDDLARVASSLWLPAGVFLVLGADKVAVELSATVSIALLCGASVGASVGGGGGMSVDTGSSTMVDVVVVNAVANMVIASRTDSPSPWNGLSSPISVALR